MDRSAALDATVNHPAALAQREMQQKLGRCMLRLQQYERALKALVASGSIEGQPERLLEVQSCQAAAQRTNTLDQLIRIFTDEYLSDGTPKTKANAEKWEGDKPAQEPLLRMRFTIAMSPELYRETVATLTELKEMRNNLVHHLIEQFDMSTEADCRAGTNYLRECYDKIDAALTQLKQWTDGHARSRAEVLAMLHSKELEDAFVHGIVPGKKR